MQPTDANASTRRRFLKFTAAAAFASVGMAGERFAFAEPATAPTAANDLGGLSLGIQSYSLRDRSFEKMLDALRGDLGLSVVEIYPGHIVGQSPRQVTDLLKRSGVRALSYGVVAFSADEAKNRVHFDLAKAIGMTNLSCDPDSDDACFANLEKLTEEYGITVAIHPHGPGHRWASRAQLESAFRGRSTRIGLCGDTGHLIRSDEDPLTVCRAFADRLHALHLKDFRRTGPDQWEDVPAGQATLDVDGIVHFLMDQRFAGGIFIEYEGGDPVKQVRASLDRVRQAVAKR